MTLTTVTVDGITYNRIAWTGGDSHKRIKSTPLFLKIRRAYFRESLRLCGGLNLWECAGTTSLERARIFWNQAHMDACATYDRLEESAK